MSALVLLGSLGTVLSTVAMLPHLTQALRTREPAGSPVAWALGAACSMVWFAYGLATHDLLVAAPGLVTIPVGLMLATWTHRNQRYDLISDLDDAALASMVIVPDWEAPEGYRAGDTLELPRIYA